MLSFYFARMKISFCLFIKSKKTFTYLKPKTYFFQPSMAHNSTIDKINYIIAERQRAYSPIAFLKNS